MYSLFEDAKGNLIKESEQIVKLPATIFVGDYHETASVADICRQLGLKLKITEIDFNERIGKYTLLLTEYDTDMGL